MSAWWTWFRYTQTNTCTLRVEGEVVNFSSLFTSFPPFLSVSLCECALFSSYGKPAMANVTATNAMAYLSICVCVYVSFGSGLIEYDHPKMSIHMCVCSSVFVCLRFFLLLLLLVSWDCLPVQHFGSIVNINRARSVYSLWCQYTYMHTPKIRFHCVLIFFFSVVCDHFSLGFSFFFIINGSNSSSSSSTKHRF